MERFVLKGKNIYSGSRVIESGFLLIEDGVIVSVGTEAEFECLDLQGIEVMEVSETCSIIPGMIDMHIHGAAGADVMDATPQALDIMTTSLPREGTTSFLATTLTEETLKCELIVDGIHIHPTVVELAFRLKGKEGLILVTDAIRAKCLGDGSYLLGNQTIQVRNGRACLEDGTLAGSILTMNESVKNTLSSTGCTLADIVWMSAVNPAKQLQLFDRKGSLDVGKDADVVVLDEHMDVLLTLCRGKVAFKKR